MSLTNTYVIARWDRPLEELRVNEVLAHTTGDEALSWTRGDGWQCFAPDGEFYRGELVPPVVEIQDEVGGPVLGLGVQSSDHWEVAFVLDGTVRWLAGGPSEEGSSAHFEAEMVQHWGADWCAAGARALSRWARPVADVDPRAIEAVLDAPHRYQELKLADLQRILTLTPDQDDPWWANWSLPGTPEHDVPGALYMVVLSDLVLPPGHRSLGGRALDLALTFTPNGVGIWDRAARTWAQDPAPDTATVLALYTARP